MRPSFLAAAAVVSWPMLAMAGSSQTYTNFCSTSQSGDVAGWKISITPYHKAYRVSYSYSEGQLMEPITTDRVSFDPGSGHLKFQLHTPFELVKFDGIASKSELVGRLKEGEHDHEEAITLKSVSSDWKPEQMPDCPPVP